MAVGTECYTCSPGLHADTDPWLPEFPDDHIPTSEEVKETQEALTAGNSALEACDMVISRLRERLLQVEAQKLELEHRMQRSRYSISSIKRVPVEIWQEIFTVALLPEWSLSVDDEVEAITLAWSHVCSRWRRILRSMPEVWSSIHLRVEDPHSGATDLISLYISNSNGHPLTISFWDSYFKSGYLNNVHQAISDYGMAGVRAVQTLMKHASQWQEVYFDISLEVLSLNKHVEELEFPVLKRIYSHRETTLAEAGGLRWLREAFERALLLTELHIPNLSNQTVQIFPVSKVRNLQLRALEDARELLPILPECTALQELDIFLLDPVFILTSQSNPSSATSQTLRKLILRARGSDTVSILLVEWLLHRLTFPSLTSLFLSGGCLWDPSNRELQRNLLSMIERSNCSLKRLTLEYPVHNTPDFLKLIRGSPELTELEFIWPEHGPSTTQDATLVDMLAKLALSPSDASQTIPSLSKLTIHTLDTSRIWTPDAIDHLIKLTRSRTGQLTELSVVLFLDRINEVLPDMLNQGEAHPTRASSDDAHTVLKDRLRTLDNDGIKWVVQRVNKVGHYE